MNYVIQNYFFSTKSLYLTPKIKFLIFLKSLTLIFYFLKNNFFLKNKIFLFNSLWVEFRIFKNFFLSENIIFFYKHFLILKYRYFNYFVESCFFLNLQQLYYFLNFNFKLFKKYKTALPHFHYNLYFSHYQTFPFNFKKTIYYKFIYYLFINNYFMWSSLFMFFENKFFFLIANDYFLLNYYHNTYFFNASSY